MTWESKRSIRESRDRYKDRLNEVNAHSAAVRSEKYQLQREFDEFLKAVAGVFGLTAHYSNPDEWHDELDADLMKSDILALHKDSMHNDRVRSAIDRLTADEFKEKEEK